MSGNGKCLMLVAGALGVPGDFLRCHLVHSGEIGKALATMGIVVTLAGGCSPAPTHPAPLDSFAQMDILQPYADILGCRDAGKEPGDEVGCDVITSDWSLLDCLNSNEADQQVNQTEGCMEVVSEVSFGSKKYGAIAYVPLMMCSCTEGDEPLLIYAIELRSDAAFSQWFGVELSMLDHFPTLDDPVVLLSGQCAVIDITFAPEHIPPKIFTCDIPWERGELIIRTNSGECETAVALKGVGIELGCASPVISCEQGIESRVGTILRLHGSGSSSPRSPIAAWNWEIVEKPEGSASDFVPSAGFPDPSFLVDFPGLYRFELEVTDCYGVGSCFPAEFEVLVVP